MEVSIQTRAWSLLAAVITSAVAQGAPDLVAGRKVFESQCAVCHGLKGGGGRGPVLARPKLEKAPDDAALRTIISEGLEPEMPAAWQLNPREVENVAAYVRSLGSVPVEVLPGNPERGARVYAAQGCAGCHIVAGEGNGLGPELTGIGARRNAAYLRQTILQPGASLPEGFLYLSVTTAEGRTVRGIRINEDSFTIQLKDAGGRFFSFRKGDLRDLRRLQGETPMPTFKDRLNKSELDDLVAWLATLRGKP
ncbi:MAG TPA: c-type cytochrome [Bryobacteraceae bacterium]|nr:c-type cytochrome [Bryobacteraceae bacterium]